MKVTIKRIAELAGVSRGTADRVLNGRGGASKETTEKVLQIAQSLDYKPNVAAKALAMKRYSKKKIGVILNAQSNPFYDDVIEGVHEQAKLIADLGFEVVVKTAKGYDVQQQSGLIGQFMEDQICGLAISPINDIEIANKINELANSGIPVVTVNTDIEKSKRLAYVGSNYEKGGRIAAGLFGMTCGQTEKIGIVTGSLKVLGHNLRIKGFKSCINQDFPRISIADIYECNDNDALAYQVTKEMLLKDQDMTGVFFTAAGTKGGLEAVRTVCPHKKLKVVTFDFVQTIKENLLNDTIMATICQEPYQQGFLSIKVLYEYIMSGILPESEYIITDTFVKTKYNL